VVLSPSNYHGKRRLPWNDFHGMFSMVILQRIKLGPLKCRIAKPSVATMTTVAGHCSGENPAAVCLKTNRLVLEANVCS